MKKRKGSLAVGFPTIVNVLILLIFACVSMLSLSRAQADRMTANHDWNVMQDYFAADRQGQIILGQIEQAVLLPPAQAGVEMETLLNEQGIAARYHQDTKILSFTLPAMQSGTLAVQLRLTGNQQYEILQWQLLPPESEEP